MRLRHGTAESLLLCMGRPVTVCVVLVFQLLGCMYGWMTFYHQGHEMANDSKGQMRDLQIRLQKVRTDRRGRRWEQCEGWSWVQSRLAHRTRCHCLTDRWGCLLFALQERLGTDVSIGRVCQVCLQPLC